MPIADTAPPDRRDETEYLVRQLMEGNAITNHRTVRQRKDGELVDVALTLSPIRDEAGELVGMAGIIRDISEELEIERERCGCSSRRPRPGAAPRSSSGALRSSSRSTPRSTARSTTRSCCGGWRGSRCRASRTGARSTCRATAARSRRLAVAHSDPKQERFAWELEDRYPTDPDATQGVPEVLRTGKPELYPEITDEMVEAERARSRAPRDHPRARPALGDARATARARADARAS